MIDPSVAYGLYNPAFAEDIGTSQIKRMFPADGDMTSFGIAGTDFSNIDIQRQLLTDTVDFKQKQKTKNIITGAIIAAATLGLGVLGYKFGKPAIKNIGKLFKKGGLTKAWNKIKDLPTKAWNYVKNAPAKIKNLFK